MSKYNFSVDGMSVEALLNKVGGVSGGERILRDELVIVEASYLQQLQRASLPPLDNRAIYQALGREAEYAKAMEGATMPAPDPNLWDLLVLPEVTCNMVMVSFQNLGLKTSDWCQDWDASLNPDYEGSKTAGPYVLGFTRSLTGESTSESANDRWKKFQKGVEGYNDPILRDGLLLMLGVYLATGKQHLLNRENWTRTRSRFHDGSVANFNANPGRVRVDYDNPGCAKANARVRPAVSRSLMPTGGRA